jgi:hypothetical protein
METKICTKCNNEYPATKNYFYYAHNKHTLATGEIKIYSYLRKICINCTQEGLSAYERNPKTKKIGQRRRSKRYKELHKEKVKEYFNKWSRENKNKIKEYKRKTKQNASEQLKKSYIKDSMKSNLGLLYKNIPDAIIEVKRQQLLLYREIKQLKYENNSTAKTA